MSAKLYMVVPQARLDIYDAALLASIIGKPRTINGQWLFEREIESDDQRDLDAAMASIDGDMTDAFGTLVADALMERADVRADEMAEAIELAREAHACWEERYYRELV